MEKTIIIKQKNDGENSITINVFSVFEVLGVLRFYEKNIWLQIQNASNIKQEKK